MPLIQMMSAVLILKMSTMPSLTAQDIHMLGSFFRIFPESHHIYQPVSQPASMQQAGQVPHLDQNDAYEQSLGQSDGSLPGPKQTLNQSINQSVHQARCAIVDGLP